MLISVLGAAAAMSLGINDGPLTVTATMGDGLDVGSTFAVTIQMERGEGWSASDGGVPGYIIQLDAPESAPPSGEVLTDFRALARNGFLQAPYERLVNADTASIEFMLASEPGADRIGFNVLAYLVHEDGSATFARRRVDLSLSPGASGSSDQQAEVSTWGLETAGLQIGDAAPDADLPDKDGEITSLSAAYADGDVILTTYRAFW